MLGRYINRIEKYLQLDLDYYIRNSFYLILARGTIMAGGLLISIAFARLVSQETYGQWNYLLSIIGICAVFSMPGMNTAITQSVATGQERVLITATKSRFKWSLLGSLVIVGLGIYYVLTGEIELGKGFIAASLFFPFFQNFESYAAFISGKKQFDTLAKYRIFTQVIVVLATVLVIYFTRNLMVIIIAYLLSFSVLRGYFFKKTSGRITKQEYDPEAISFGKHMTVTQAPGIIRQHYDKLIIALFLSFPELAVYSIALSFSHLLNPLRSIIASLILPKLSQMDARTAYAEVRKRWYFIVIGFGAIGGTLIALCPYLIPFLYSKEYTGSVFYAQLLLVSLIIAAPTPVINKALFPSQRRIKDLYKLNIAGFVVSIVLLTVLVHYYGLIGAAIAIIVTRAFNTTYSLKLAGFLAFRTSEQAGKQ